MEAWGKAPVNPPNAYLRPKMAESAGFRSSQSERMPLTILATRLSPPLSSLSAFFGHGHGHQNKAEDEHPSAACAQEGKD
jgi:hypothetical protein